jgi:hypothetical protein
MRQFALLLAEVAHATLSKLPSYADVILLDEKVRAVCRALPEDSQPASIPPLTGSMFFSSFKTP